jgi:hypothetical protein
MTAHGQDRGTTGRQAGAAENVALVGGLFFIWTKKKETTPLRVVSDLSQYSPDKKQHPGGKSHTGIVFLVL